MRITQIVYKVDDLAEASAQASCKGLVAEYGRKKNPYNAFIYFSDETFLELVDNMGIPRMIKGIMRIFNRRFVKRFEQWDKAGEGPLGIGIQVTKYQIFQIEKYLKEKYQIRSFRLTSKRKDVHNVVFEAKCLFPENAYLPFFVTKYRNSGDGVLHKNLNGDKRVKHLDITLQEKEYEIVKDLFSKFELWDDLGASIEKGKYGFKIKIL